MIIFCQDKNETRVLIKYVAITVTSILLLAFINFGLVAHNLHPVNIILPFFIGTIVGVLLAYNKILQLRLIRSNNTKSQFLSRMNHELRSPMNAIIGFSDLLQDGDNLTEDQQDAVKQILYAGNHTIALINELLDFSRIETGKVSLSLIELSPLMVMTQAVDMMQSMASKNNITVQHKIPDSEPCNIMADEVRLTEVFVNLLSNAIKYNRENGQIKIGYRQGPDKLEISVCDTGIGIEESQTPYLFEPFNRLGAEKTDIEGTGVGLSITRSLVEMMKGCISCESKRGRGTCFTLSFPIARHPISLEQNTELHSPQT